MSPKPKHIEALVASRICHDLAGSVGAIMNGFELAQLSEEMRTDSMEFELITDSISQLNARLQLCRIAFGPFGAGQSLQNNILADALNAATHGAVSIHLDVPAEMSRTEGKLICLGTMCLISLLPRGGEIKIDMQDSHYRLVATGTNVAVPEIWQSTGEMSHNSESLPKIEFILFDTYLREHSAEREVQISDNMLTLTIPKLAP